MHDAGRGPEWQVPVTITATRRHYLPTHLGEKLALGARLNGPVALQVNLVGRAREYLRSHGKPGAKIPETALCLGRIKIHQRRCGEKADQYKDRCKKLDCLV